MSCNPRGRWGLVFLKIFLFIFFVVVAADLIEAGQNNIELTVS